MKSILNDQYNKNKQTKMKDIIHNFKVNNFFIRFNSLE